MGCESSHIRVIVHGAELLLVSDHGAIRCLLAVHDCRLMLCHRSRVRERLDGYLRRRRATRSFGASYLLLEA